MSSSHSKHDHPSQHPHSSPEHQHGALLDTSVHSPHRHNHAASAGHHSCLHSHDTHPEGTDCTYQDNMATSNTANAADDSTQLKLNMGEAGDNPTYASTDPTTSSSAKTGSKIVGDLKGMAHGVAGSVQAAVGTTFGQKGMAQKGFEKMSEEDARLAAKSGKEPVGTERRSKTINASQVGGAEHGRAL